MCFSVQSVWFPPPPRACICSIQKRTVPPAWGGEGPGGRGASFPCVQSVLEFGAGVPQVEALLVDGVIRVELDHDRIAGGGDLFRGLRGEATE